MSTYRVVVGNIGEVHSGKSRIDATKVYDSYVIKAESGAGRAAGEDVHMFCDGVLCKEHVTQAKVTKNPSSGTKQRLRGVRKAKESATQEHSEAVKFAEMTRKHAKNDFLDGDWKALKIAKKDHSMFLEHAKKNRPILPNPSMTKEDFYKLLKSNAKTGKWLNGTYDVEGVSVGVKANGLWIQRLQIEGVPHYLGGSMGHKTQKAMIEEVSEYLDKHLHGVSKNPSGAKQRARGTREVQSKRDFHSFMVGGAENVRKMSKQDPSLDDKDWHKGYISSAKKHRPILPNPKKEIHVGDTVYFEGKPYAVKGFTHGDPDKTLKFKTEVKRFYPKTISDSEAVYFLRADDESPMLLVSESKVSKIAKNPKKKGFDSEWHGYAVIDLEDDIYVVKAIGLGLFRSTKSLSEAREHAERADKQQTKFYGETKQARDLRLNVDQLGHDIKKNPTKKRPAAKAKRPAAKAKSAVAKAKRTVAKAATPLLSLHKAVKKRLAKNPPDSAHDLSNTAFQQIQNNPRKLRKLVRK